MNKRKHRNHFSCSKRDYTKTQYIGSFVLNIDLRVEKQQHHLIECIYINSRDIVTKFYQKEFFCFIENK